MIEYTVDIREIIEEAHKDTEDFKMIMNNKAKRISRITGKSVLECYKWLISLDLANKNTTSEGSQ